MGFGGLWQTCEGGRMRRQLCLCQQCGVRGVGWIPCPGSRSGAGAHGGHGVTTRLRQGWGRDGAPARFNARNPSLCHPGPGHARPARWVGGRAAPSSPSVPGSARSRALPLLPLRARQPCLELRLR